MPDTHKTNDTRHLALSSHALWLVLTQCSQSDRERIMFDVFDILLDSCLSPYQKKQLILAYLDANQEGFDFSVSRDCLVSSLLNLNSSN